jgi:TfoX/Sxy family transcriptional regulator of competence genes
MPWEKSPPDLVELFYSVLPSDPALERRKMFGYPCAFVHGHMFTGLYEHSMIVKLQDDQYQQLMAIEGAAPFEPMAGRPMRGYVVLPDSVLQDTQALRGWVSRAFATAAALEPKVAKPRKSAKKPA